ncbi:MAG: sugar phosphate isomerase/epimerase [Planctomycetaceae bacterium]|nr:sugar phosphate isomerase/epimerase [Planctomycetaceae bacterium]
MLPLQLAVATSSFRQPLRQCIDTAARTGASGVLFDARAELPVADYGDTARRQLLHELDERRLKVAALTFPLRRPIHDPEQIDRRMEALRSAMKFASLLRCRLLTISAPRTAADPESREAQRIGDVLEELARYGNHVGVTPALTPVGDPPEKLISILANVKQGPMAVDFDPAGCVRSGRDPVRDLREYATWLGHLHLRDGIHGRDGDGKETAVGRGEVAWPELLAQLQEIGYRGWLTARRTDGDDPAGDVTRALEYVRRVTLGG